MVSVSSIALAVTSVIAISSSIVTADNLPVGKYYRPTGSIVSGVPGTTAQYRRSPCPALNTLANHGYLPRNGQGVTRADLNTAFMTIFNADNAVATSFTKNLPDVFNLDVLGKHNFIEHDASLVHADSYLRGDPANADPRLLQDFLSRASASKPFTVQTIGQVRRERLAECKRINPNCTFGAQQSFLAFNEAASVLKLFGDGATDTASLSNVRSFLVEEKFPVGFKKPQLLTPEGLAKTAALVQAAATA